ncbi:alpha/beta hydrolase [Actinomycetospora sp. TBRC 11914]|uniref:alpha/beta hydrolase n=1 Tax=Actinomycetospora sp. TBRC 11914 TaxID=2729387 RepID=UPI00145D5F45|nr:alpha/beta hydrolase [Actinomycetospora sp. TBRC 11914]NMO90492.1 alpha/beta hydrolase [Actinomycetospora sp. TBRC 11914]
MSAANPPDAAVERPADDLDPDVAALLGRLRDRAEPAMFAGTDTPEGVAAARARYAALLAETVRPAEGRPELVTDAPVPLRVHRPGGRASGALVVFVHGGGWVLGGGGAYDPVARRLAEDTDAVVVAVDYRLAPEHPFPAPHDDVLAAVDWVVRHADRWDADPARLGLAGDSAGANLVAGAALARRDAGTPAVVTLLVYPPPDFEGRYPSVRENADGYLLTAADVVACSRLYLAGTSPRGEPRLSPLRADLAGLGPTIVATAGFDPLRDAGHTFAEALAAAGVDVRRREHPSLVHGFLGLTGVSRAADDAVAALHAEVGSLLGGPAG